MWSAPLLVATDVLKMPEERKQILSNRDVLAVHSDPLFIAGERLRKDDHGGQVWTRPLSNGDFAVVLYNANNITSLPISIQWTELEWNSFDKVLIKDLWSGEVTGPAKVGHTATVAPNDVSMLRLTREKCSSEEKC
jgi:alpha-galactosidase